MIAYKSVALAASVTAILSACGGGGGGGGGPGVVDVPFTSFTVQPNQRVTLSGTAQTATGGMNTIGGELTIFPPTYSAVEDGFYVKSLGMPFSTAASMTETVDFSARS